jgi:mannose-6-phosphate isomerase-like protein (cupin superfamily)
MPIIDNAGVEVFELPGIRHQTVGGHAQGVASMEVWMQTMAPGAVTPVHRHACEEVIVVLSGSGECTVAGVTSEFGPNTTLIIEPDVVHQIVNTSTEDLRLVAVLGMAPVRVRTAEGERLPVPWDAP